MCVSVIHTAFGQTANQSTLLVEKIADGFQFVEGPVWKDGGLLFSDIPANTVYRWTPDSGTFVFLSPSGNSNGLALDLQGRLLLAQHGKRQVARREYDGLETALATHYNGKRLNSPNDMAVKSDGWIFFTDPPYGISANQEELGFYGIYSLSPSVSLRLLDPSLNRPNGITFSPDENKLYVGDAETRRIYVWDVVSDTVIANKRQFAFMNASGYTDGMKTDAEGHVFSTGPFGVWVYDSNGVCLDTIPVPGQTTNCGWGDADGNTLYITSGSAVYRIHNTYTHVSGPKQGPPGIKSFELYSNYPNPFNGSTNIPFTLSKPDRVRITILTLLGERVATLADQPFAPGRHAMTWHAENMATGMYCIQLSTSRGSDLKKCLLLR